MVMKLLSAGDSNTKLRKSGAKLSGYLIYGLSLRPLAGSGFNVCPHATDGCIEVCVLEWAGMSNLPSVRAARTRKTRLFFENRAQCISWLIADIERAQRAAARKGLQCAIRLNVASDIPWEKHIDMSAFPDVVFYDYCKSTHRFDNLPVNYHLTYSHNENSDARAVNRILKSGHNVAVVFDTVWNPSQHVVGVLPDTHTIGRTTHRVIDGDVHDIRLPWHDGGGSGKRGVIVGLRGKGGKGKVQSGVESGFVIPTIGGVTSAA